MGIAETKNTTLIRWRTYVKDVGVIRSASRVARLI